MKAVFPARTCKALFLIALTAGCASPSAGSSGPQLPGAKLATDVERVVHAREGSVYCDDTDKVEAGVITDCHADDNIGKWRVTFDDDKGHFTITDSS